MVRKNSTLLAVVLIILLVSIVACQPATTGTDTTPTDVEVTFPTQEPPSLINRDIRLDPATVDDSDSLLVSGYLYDGLVRLDSNGNPQPALAVSWTISEDELDYIFVLRPDVYFGGNLENPLNADAVLANFNRWFDPQGPLHGEGIYAGWERHFLGFKGEKDANDLPVSFFDGIEKVNNSTVLIHLNRLEPTVLEILAQPYFYIVDPQALMADGDEYGTSQDSVSGTGAYQISSWSDSGLVLQPNTDYWGGAPGGDITFGWR